MVSMESNLGWEKAFKKKQENAFEEREASIQKERYQKLNWSSSLVWLSVLSHYLQCYVLARLNLIIKAEYLQSTFSRKSVL